MNRYEGLFILNTADREESIQDTVDKLTADITDAGGKVETVQKMDKKTFARVANKKHAAGFYVNIVFQGTQEIMQTLKGKFDLGGEVFRVLYTRLPDAEKTA